MFRTQSSVLLLAALFCMLRADLFALTPQPTPHTHKIFSANGNFYAHCLPRKQRVEIKQVRRWWFDKKLWFIDNYIEWADVADDGSYVILEGHLIAPPFSKKTEVIWVYLPNGKTRSFTLGQFVSDTTKLEPAMGLGSYGGSTILSGDWLRVRTCEHRILYANTKTGVIRTRAPDGL